MSLGDPSTAFLVDYVDHQSASLGGFQPVQETGPVTCGSHESVAGLNAETISLICEPVRVTYSEVTVTITDADVPPELGESRLFGGSCPASHPVAVGGTVFYHSTGESGVDNRPELLDNPPFFFRRPAGGTQWELGLSSWSSFALPPGAPEPPPSYTPVVPFAFSTTVTFMTECWLSPSNPTSAN